MAPNTCGTIATIVELEKEFGPLGTLCALDHTGDSRMQWDKKDLAQVAKARARFDELKAKGYMAYKLNAKGDQGEVLTSFDPDAERIIMHSAMIGG